MKPDHQIEFFYDPTSVELLKMVVHTTLADAQRFSKLNQ
jgi:hypothetical protein